MTRREDLPEEFLQKLQSVTGKRARIVIDHILAHGYITTEELEKTYGYNHPPRAARDVREQGIPLETFKVKSSDGRRIAAYRFGNLADVRDGMIGGRKMLPKALKDALYAESEGRCAVCNGRFAQRYLQIDHRIPYQIAGDMVQPGENVQDYLLLCGACNRAKSWSCEHCPNWKTKSSQICTRCYWAFPQDYTHIALREVRRADIIWAGEEIQVYNRLRDAAQKSNLAIPDYVKQVIREQFE
ncbi:MAG TPA: HNH endonuclease [Anaerolineae bacterium]|nr:HNH endonuclease [Anaerolineae bacterium]